MNLKRVIGFSLIAFMASSSILLVVGLVLTHPTPEGVVSNQVSLPTTAPTPVVSLAPGQTPPPATPVPVVYCQGKTPCYGKADVAAHAAVGACWGYNLDWVVNLTGYAPVHPVGPSFVENTTFCGKDVHGALTGAVQIQYTHVHKAETQENAASSILASYRVGYFDPTKP